LQKFSAEFDEEEALLKGALKLITGTNYLQLHLGSELTMG
jgi:hypothetical protein